MVRSCTSPVAGATARPSVSTQPNAMWTAPIAYERSTTPSSASPAATRTSTRSTSPESPTVTRAPATAPPSAATHASRSTDAERSSRTSDRRSAPATCNAPSSRTARSARPVARSVDVVVGPATIALVQSPSSVIAYGQAIGAVNASGAPTTVPRTRRVAPTKEALAEIGGRLGPRRTTSSRAYTTRTARPARSASSRAATPTGDATFPPNAPPLASGDAGSPPGSHHDASGSRYAGSTHDVLSRTPSLTGADGARGGTGSTVVRRPCTLPAIARASSSDSATTHDLPAASTALAVDPGGSGTATSASRGAPSSAKPPSPNGTRGPTSCDAPPSSSARRAAAAASRAAIGVN